MSSFIEGLVAGYGIAVPVGAVAVLIVNVAIRCGFGIGFIAGAGAATADLFYAVLASAAGSVLVAVLETVSSQLRILSGTVLIGLGVYGLWEGLRRSDEREKSAKVCGPMRMYGQFLGITVINPLTVVYFTALILGRGAAASDLLEGHLLFVIGVGVSSLSWQTVLAGLGGIARSRLSKRFHLSATIIGNLIVIGLGLRILLVGTIQLL